MKAKDFDNFQSFSFIHGLDINKICIDRGQLIKAEFHNNS